MQFTMTVNMDSPAFADAGPDELARILQKVAQEAWDSTILLDGTRLVIDVNGRTVGSWEVTA